MYTSMRANQGVRNVSFSDNFVYILNENPYPMCNWYKVLQNRPSKIF